LKRWPGGGNGRDGDEMEAAVTPPPMERAVEKVTGRWGWNRRRGVGGGGDATANGAVEEVARLGWDGGNNGHDSGMGREEDRHGRGSLIRRPRRQSCGKTLPHRCCALGGGTRCKV
jgi:hypothetical protein